MTQLKWTTLNIIPPQQWWRSDPQSPLKEGGFSGMYQTFQILHCTLKCSGLKEVDYDPDKAILSGFLLALIPISEHLLLTQCLKYLKFLTRQWCLFGAQVTHSGKERSEVWPEAENWRMEVAWHQRWTGACWKQLGGKQQLLSCSTDSEEVFNTWEKGEENTQLIA